MISFNAAKRHMTKFLLDDLRLNLIRKGIIMGIKEKLAAARTSDWLTKDLTDLRMKQVRDLAFISAAIELRRKSLGMNQKQFASFMGVSQAMVSKWESGEYNFTINTLNEICYKLGLEFDPNLYNLHQGRSQFKIINIRTLEKDSDVIDIPISHGDSYKLINASTWAIA